MLKREDLEKLNWTIAEAKMPVDGEFDCAVCEPLGAIVGEFFGRVGPSEKRPAQAFAGLASASPALALACLKADKYADMIERGEQVHMAETAGLRKALRAALSSAGVDVGQWPS